MNQIHWSIAQMNNPMWLDPPALGTRENILGCLVHGVGVYALHGIEPPIVTTAPLVAADNVIDYLSDIQSIHPTFPRLDLTNAIVRQVLPPPPCALFTILMDANGKLYAWRGVQHIVNPRPGIYYAVATQRTANIQLDRSDHIEKALHAITPTTIPHFQSLWKNGFPIPLITDCFPAVDKYPDMSYEVFPDGSAVPMIGVRLSLTVWQPVTKKQFAHELLDYLIKQRIASNTLKMTMVVVSPKPEVQDNIYNVRWLPSSLQELYEQE